jgi:enoyl-CoA hydratase/carnithine racemase
VKILFTKSSVLISQEKQTGGGAKAMKTDYNTIKVEIKEDVAVFTIDNPPVNQMSPQLGEDFREAITEAFGDDDVKAIVITGTGKNFIAGADITQLQKVKDREEIFQIALGAAQFLSSIEVGPKPVVAAINGNCLGGGLETAMVCHYRVAANGVNLGQPEVQIGLIPGAGGTQRLPRLIGLPNAMEMITVGKPITADKAYRRGLVDEVVEANQLLDAALKAAGRFVRGDLNQQLRMTRNRNDRIPSFSEKTALVNYSKFTAAQKAKGYIAPFKAIEAIEKGLSYDIEADIEKEVGLFADCAVSEVAKNLIGIFLNTRAAGRLPRIEGVKPAEIKKVAMLGGGVMGSGIVSVLLNNKCSPPEKAMIVAITYGI